LGSGGICESCALGKLYYLGNCLDFCPTDWQENNGVCEGEENKEKKETINDSNKNPTHTLN